MTEREPRNERRRELREPMDTARDQPMTPFQERVGNFAVQWMAGANTLAFRLSRGRAAAQVPGGAPICLVTTTGRRTGRRRTVPLLYLPYRDDQIVVVASYGGMSAHPAWYLNLRANPRATVEVGGERFEMATRLATAAERSELWPTLAAVYPRFEAYQRRTTRVIEVLILAPMFPEHDSRPRRTRREG
jgi:deazaflavin-dependent oxidoreductase (nitroreductase family)